MKMKRSLFLLCAVVPVLLSATAFAAKPAKKQQEAEKVENIILMIGDGMGLAHVTALMIENEYRPIQMERAPVTGFVKTHSANNRVTDSAAAGTAFSTGQKTNNSRLGLDSAGNRLHTILEKADARGMATGVVVTSGVVHATPGAFFGHSMDRRKYKQVALGLLDTDIDVLIGSGRQYLEEGDPSIIGKLEKRGCLVVRSLEELDDVSEGRSPEYLPQATAKALEIVTNNSRGKGFFLMVEGSLIDKMCHANDAAGMLAEIRDFDNAVGVALDYAQAHPGTLVIILADHETGGLAIPSGNADFHLSESGIGYVWGSVSHTASMVPLFAYGPCATRFGGVLENDEIGRRMQEVLGLQP